MIVAFAISSCDKETTEGLSSVTNYPLITMDGDNPTFVAKGASFVDPGVMATENGAEIDVVTTASGAYRGGSTLDVNVSDWYDVTYTATNKDGFDGTAHRDVYVVETGDLVNSIEGLYTCTVIRNGTTSAQYTDMEYVLVWKKDDGTYEMSCGIGAYYQLGRGYGNGYRSGGAVIKANDISANDFEFTTFQNNGFKGDTDISTMTVDPVTKTISYTSEWAFGYTFEVVLTQVAL